MMLKFRPKNKFRQPLSVNIYNKDPSQNKEVGKSKSFDMIVTAVMVINVINIDQFTIKVFNLSDYIHNLNPLYFPFSDSLVCFTFIHPSFYGYSKPSLL